MIPFILTTLLLIPFIHYLNNQFKTILYKKYFFICLLFLRSYYLVKKMEMFRTPASATPPVCFIKTITIRNDGSFLVNSKPFFPFGAYGLGWSATEGSKIQALNGLIAAGFTRYIFSCACLFNSIIKLRITIMHLWPSFIPSSDLNNKSHMYCLHEQLVFCVP